jgi:hypothetical protein
VTIGDTGLQTAAISYSNSEVYTLTLAGTYGVGGLTLDYTVTSTGGDNVNLVVTDPTPLTGQHFGIETFNGQTVEFDNFSLAAIPEPSAMLTSALGLLGVFLRRRRVLA